MNARSGNEKVTRPTPLRSMKIENRTFVISGGASGLGRAYVEAILDKGGYVAILDIIQDLQKVTDEVNLYTGKAVGGVIPIVGVATASKIIDQDMNPFSINDFDFVLDIKFRKTIDLVRQSLPYMTKSELLDEDDERGVIVLVSSIAAFDGQRGQVAYVASKGSISSLTLPLARDLSKDKIRVLTIAPGLFDTRMTAIMIDKQRNCFKNSWNFSTWKTLRVCPIGGPRHRKYNGERCGIEAGWGNEITKQDMKSLEIHEVI